MNTAPNPDPSKEGNPKPSLSRRSLLGRLGLAAAAVVAAPAAHAAKTTTKKFLVQTGAPEGYDPYDHKWQMALDANRCIGCGSCVEACKKENLAHLEHLPQKHYYRTWIERYIVKKPKPGSAETRGEVVVDSPEGGRHGFPPSPVRKEDILQSFFVPKLCNLCEHSPCAQVCPVGATFDTPDGAVLVDPLPRRSSRLPLPAWTVPVLAQVPVVTTVLPEIGRAHV